MSAKPFQGPWLKLARARQHIAELEREIASYLSRDPWAMFVERNIHTGKHILSLRGREPIPPELSAIFGDAVHNLRVALDIMANDVVAMNGVEPKNVYFPFADTSSGIEKQIQQKMGGAAPDVIELVRALKPYRGGNELLRALHDLDIRDKHIMPLQAVASAATPALPMMQTGPNTWLADLSKLSTVPIDTTGFVFNPDTTVIGKVVEGKITIAIDKGLPLAGQQAVGALNQLADLVQGVIETFEAHCLRGKGS